MLTSVCPIFPSNDFAITAEFYQELGFIVAFQYDAEGYLILTRDEIELHFFKANAFDPYKSDHGAFVRVADANELSRAFQSLKLPTEGIPRITSAEDKPWGICEFAIVDPDGTLLRVGHLLS